MDMQTPDHQHEPEPGSRLSQGFATRLLKDLAAIIPADAPDRELREQDMRELFESLQPRDAADAQLAVFAIAAVHAGMNSLIRGGGPEIPDETATKLRSGAMAAGRFFLTASRHLRKRQPKVPKQKPPAREPSPRTRAPQPEPKPEPRVIPDMRGFQPRNRFGQPIPLWRNELMTKAQRRALHVWPRNPELEAAAVAEEEAMIAEQAKQAELTTEPQSPPSGTG
jgi:hypothetical protein